MSTVFRVEKTANYTVMSNTHLKDRRLSYKAKGLLSVILSLPPDWDYTITGLAVIAADGVDSVKTAVRELEQYGYVTRSQLRDEFGRMSQNEYKVYENPADNPEYVPEKTEYVPEKSRNVSDKSRNAAEKSDYVPENVPNDNASPKGERNFSVSPSAENPSAVIPTADNTQADNILILNKNILNTDASIHSFTPAQARADRTESTDKRKKTSSVSERELYREIIRGNIRYEDKYARDIGERQLVDELVSIMTDVVCSGAQTVRVNGDALPHEVVKSRFLKLTDEEIDYVLYALENYSSRVGNMRAYLITTLYNSKSTVSNFYANLANNDIREGVV